MVRYIKANPKVVEYLNLGTIRNRVNDGNYLLWQADILSFGPLSQLSSILMRIGAISLMPSEARQEQDGIILRPLPEATDERFFIPSSNSDTITKEEMTNEEETKNEQRIDDQND